MKNIRIVWAIAMPINWKTGGQKYYKEVVQHLQSKNWELVFYTPPRGISNSRLFNNLVCNIKIATFLLSIARKDNIIVEDSEWHSRFLLSNILLRLFKPVSIVTVTHHLSPRDLIARRDPFGILMRKLDWLVTGAFFRTVNKIIAVSESTKRDIVATGIPSNKVEIIPDGADRIPQISVSRNGSGSRILFVGHCSPIKGVNYLLEAIWLLKDSDIVLDLVGDLEGNIEYTRSLQEMTRIWGISDKIIFHGFVHRERIIDLYTEADIFVLPSLWEGFGIVLLEAMAFNLPVIATTAGAIPELVKDGVNGLLVPPANSRALAEAIAALIQNPGLRKKLGKNGRAIYNKSLTWEQIVEKFEKLLFRLNANVT